MPLRPQGLRAVDRDCSSNSVNVAWLNFWSLSGRGWFDEGGSSVVRAQQDRAFKSWLINFTVQAGWNKPCGNVKQRLLKRKRPPCDWAKYHKENNQGTTAEQQLLKVICLTPKEIQTDEISHLLSNSMLCPSLWDVTLIWFSKDDERHLLNLHWYHYNDGLNESLLKLLVCNCSCTLVWQYSGADLHVDSYWLCCHTAQGYLNF